MAEKGYRIKRGDKWVEVRRICGNYLYREFSSEPNTLRMSEKVAKQVIGTAADDIKNEFSIVECGTLTPEEETMSFRQYVSRSLNTI